MIDNRCCTYALISDSFIWKASLLYIKIPLWTISRVNEQESLVYEITKFTLNVDGVVDKAAAYIILSIYNYNIILGKTWLERFRGVLDFLKKTLTSTCYNILVRDISY